ncbi:MULTISPECIES: DEAD/DEAH box helicase [Xanthomonas translucens group]|uniref:DEAD-box ATP-dependent RNA helicase RhpA n=14 Tax=Xanthomonas translucens group TaxID=3390202 RepID=A0A0K2ZR92_9XANT|nr:RNA helicase [Xanthomonas translucens pv. undulosa]KTF39546.1 RNA helicase [Xanthomonas translucens pv. translucens]KWV13785.1 RNA helicase [Xanthomonas translucens]OAX64198.1 RNA helicase [Xanthomonas translucens pv. arrhenatheri]UKE43031.1 DEAD/DEAH box helicase [Xanthomonas translucens pv. secalis]UKE58677.1 DEAD/DEAH box helicase [Xanthomonas translucens pv. hordei]UKE61463.1 DEAD/DEAH box helicase [Xanthomonas translucens pv. poae]CTP87492.1 ATP-dependent RNA helicase RhlE [Xanthomon
MSFESLGLAPFLLRALAEQGYETPTPIQLQAIPLALAGHDLMAGAQTGTGKTAAFGLPLLQHLGTSPQPVGNGARRPRALILTPTRELATQVHDSLRGYSKYLRIPSTTIYGGVGMGNQLDALRRGVDLLIACPGRLLDHLERRSVDLSGIEILVLDEADRMLDMGFLPSIKRILAKLPKQNRQTLLFSATFEEGIKQLAREFMHNPQEIQATPSNTVADTITHRVHPVDGTRKRELLLHLLAADSRMQTLVFARTKHGADKLTMFLDKSGLKTAAIHGNKSQGQRLRALSDFKAGRITVLVATDIAARGIDIDQLPKVINYDLPMVAEDYVHRIGRTGRNGAQGEAVSLVAQDEAKLLRAISRMLKREMDIRDVPGFEPSTPIRWGNNNPADERPGGQRPPRKSTHVRRPHGDAPRAHAHAGAKPAGGTQPGGARRQGERRRSGGGQPSAAR